MIRMPITIENLVKNVNKGRNAKLKVLYLKFCSCRNAYEIKPDTLAPDIFNDYRHGCHVKVSPIIDKKDFERCSKCPNYEPRKDEIYSEEIIKKFEEL